jgi:RNA-directed DNA polymerase
VGLELSNEKTRITHISNGFNFLGFNFKKPEKNGMIGNGKLLITPQSEKVDNLRYKLKKILKIGKDLPQEVVIQKLNPVITGWGMYYRHVVSKVIFNKLDRYTWNRLWLWSRRENGGKPTGKHFRKKGKRERVFCDKETGKRMSTLASIPIKRFIKINNDHRVYDVKSKEYWEKREYQNAKNSILGLGALNSLYSKQKGKCPYCKQLITIDEVSNVEFHKHHMKPRSEGGNDTSSNLRLLHKSCHQALHVLFTRKDMGKYTNIGIDYIKLMKFT